MSMPVFTPNDFRVRKMARHLSSGEGAVAHIGSSQDRAAFAGNNKLASVNPTLWPKAKVIEYVAMHEAAALKSYMLKKSLYKLAQATNAGGFTIADEQGLTQAARTAPGDSNEAEASAPVAQTPPMVEEVPVDPSENPLEPPFEQMLKLANEIHKGVHGTAMIDEACEISTRRKIVWGSLTLSLQRLGLAYDEACDVAYRSTVLDAVLPEHQTLMAEIYQTHMGRDPRIQTTTEKRWVTKIRKDISTKLNGQVVHSIAPVALAATMAGVPLWLGGPRGGGKSFLASQICEYMDYQRPVPVQGSNQVTVEDVIGAMGARSGSTIWEDGSFTAAWRAKAPVVIDEFSAWNGDIHLELHGVLNGDGELFVRATQEVVIGESPVIVTDNSIGLGEADAYIGTQVVNAATRDRFAFVVVGMMDPKVELTAVRDALKQRAAKLSWSYEAS